MVEGVSVPLLICMVLDDSLQILDISAYSVMCAALLVPEMNVRSGSKSH